MDVEGGEVGVDGNVHVEDGNVHIKGDEWGVIGDVTIEGGEVIIEGGILGELIVKDGDTRVENENGPAVDGNVTVEDGTVVLDGGDDDKSVTGDLTIEDGVVFVPDGVDGDVTLDGNGILHIDELPEGSQIDNGIVFEKNEDGTKDGTVYGEVVLDEDLVIPPDTKLVIDEDATLIIKDGVTLDNDGEIIVDGILVNDGTIENEGSIENNGLVHSDGDINGNEITGNDKLEGTTQAIVMPVGVVGGAYSYAAVAAEELFVGRVTWEALDTLPQGLTFNPANGLVSGNPEVATTDAVFRLRASSQWFDVVREYSVRINDFSAALNLSVPNDEQSPVGQGWSFNKASKTYRIFGDTSIIGSTTTARVVVEAGADVNIAMNGVSIDATALSGKSAFDMTGATVRLTTVGAVELKSGADVAALQAASGSLEIQGNNDNEFSVTGGVGINGGEVTMKQGKMRVLGTSGVGIAGGTLCMNGDGIVYANNVTSELVKTKGILFNGTIGEAYGAVALAEDLTVPNGYILKVLPTSAIVIPSGKTLQGVGQIQNKGIIIVDGTLAGNVVEDGVVWKVTEDRIVLPSVLQDSVYECIFSSQAVAGLTWSVSAGNLPTGVSIGSSSGNATGMATETGTFNFTVSVTDGVTTVARDYKQNVYELRATINVGDESHAYNTEGTGWSYNPATKVYTVTGDVIIEGTTTERSIQVTSGSEVNIRLKNVSISSGICALDITGAKATVALEGVNTLTGGVGYAGIAVPAGATLVINGSTADVLNVFGQGNVGIGGAGDITMNGGTVSANGDGDYAGIAGNILVQGGTLTAVGGGSNDVSGTLVLNGNGIVFINSTEATVTKTKGLLFMGNIGEVYGDMVLQSNLSLTAEQSLLVAEGASLAVAEGVELNIVGGGKMGGAEEALATDEPEDEASGTEEPTSGTEEPRTTEQAAP